MTSFRGAVIPTAAIAALLAAAALPSCDVQQRTPRPGSGSEALKAPPDSEIPEGVLGASIRRGRAILAHTRDSLPDHVGSNLRCFSCHLNQGEQEWAYPLVGVYSRFPQYRSRTGLVIRIEDRVNDCFERSLAGVAIPRESAEMRDIVAYLAFISRGVAPPGVVAGMGSQQRTPLTPDTARGRGVFAEICVRCHGQNGEGTGIAPALWGPKSFAIGAAMARLRVAAGFIRDNMPFDKAVVLTDQQAFDVAGYMVTRQRPDFPGKENDWPNGDRPPDVPYPTKAGVKVPLNAKP